MSLPNKDLAALAQKAAADWYAMARRAVEDGNRPWWARKWQRDAADWSGTSRIRLFEEIDKNKPS